MPHHKCGEIATVSPLINTPTPPRQWIINGPATGFTLIELLVVIAIISILIGLLLPALATVNRQAKLTACAAGQRQLATATYAYGTDHAGRIPRGPTEPSPFGVDWSHFPTHTLWIGAPMPPVAAAPPYTGAGVLLSGYVTNKQAFYCPGDDTLFPTRELDRIGSAWVAYSSYAYRSLAETTNDRLSDLGQNTLGESARALFMDIQIDVPTPDFAHSAHGMRYVNVAYLDGHVETLSNQDGRMTFRATDMTDAAINAVARESRIFVEADCAEGGHGPCGP